VKETRLDLDYTNKWIASESYVINNLKNAILT